MMIQNIPGPSIPVLQPDGRISQVWFQFFISLFNRSGGTQGNDLALVLTRIADLQQQSNEGMTGQGALLEPRLKQLEQEANQGVPSNGALLARVADLEVTQASNVAHSEGLIGRVADLEVKSAEISAAAAASTAGQPVGFAKVLIAGVVRTIAYY